MNLVDCEVKQILSLPFKKYGKWWVEVLATSEGKDFKHSLMVDTAEEAYKIKIGHKFLS